MESSDGIFLHENLTIVIENVFFLSEGTLMHKEGHHSNYFFPTHISGFADRKKVVCIHFCQENTVSFTHWQVSWSQKYSLFCRC